MSKQTAAATTPRFTERGAECRKQHVEGYTGPICSCGPVECKATRDHSDNERFDPVASAAIGAGCTCCAYYVDGRLVHDSTRCPIHSPLEQVRDQVAAYVQDVETLEQQRDAQFHSTEGDLLLYMRGHPLADLVEPPRVDFLNDLLDRLDRLTR